MKLGCLLRGRESYSVQIENLFNPQSFHVLNSFFITRTDISAISVAVFIIHVVMPTSESAQLVTSKLTPLVRRASVSSDRDPFLLRSALERSSPLLNVCVSGVRRHVVRETHAVPQPAHEPRRARHRSFIGFVPKNAVSRQIVEHFRAVRTEPERVRHVVIVRHTFRESLRPRTRLAIVLLEVFHTRISRCPFQLLLASK